MKNFARIMKLRGTSFVKELLKYEQERFDKFFMKGSVFEEINADFGIFPPVSVYPVYFSGNVDKPKNKLVVIGINPGYNVKANEEEQSYLKEVGLYQGYCHIFENFFKKRRRGLLAYFAKLVGFLKRLNGTDYAHNNWDWLQENLINLELIPFHSANAAGIRINNLKKYNERYFKVILKLLDHIKPRKPIILNGFPGFARYFGEGEFAKLISFKKVDNFWVGKLAGRYDFIGVPFLGFARGGLEPLARKVRRYWKDKR